MTNIGTTISKDYRKFYSIQNLKYLLGGIGVTGVFANTKLDPNTRDWYQESIRDNSTDQFSKMAKPIGNIYEPIGIYAGITILGSLTKHTDLGATAFKWGSQSLRAIIVGAPAVGILQYVLGASRPYEGGSDWRPFHDTNAVSGHAFMGAIPFLTISKMVKSPYLKTFFYVNSTATALSRINDDQHYLSQSLAGWWIAYLAVNSLDRGGKKTVDLRPSFFRDGWRMELCFSL